MQRKLFIEGKNQRTRAYFGWQDKDTAFYGVKMGYKNAADKLVDDAIESGLTGAISTLDTFIFPICFLYRNSIEVSLKGIYMRYCGGLLKGGHDLVLLWNNLYNEVILNIQDDKFLDEVKKYKKKFVLYSFNDIDYGEIRALFNEFNQINDQKADVFRYLLDKNGELYFTDNKFIDYPNLKETMDYIYKALDYIYTVVDEYLSS
ncbi:hypothetical protein EZV73_15230 [Acidaminobacter sp. JC074]|uniref:hypothetical protein n=1 Tax=Acidaminobacter sp. JC074 TaxID=2530199 RepID=UPI001F0F420D|nr:hypothetical protein [Acidaminobacter sp. JC074]MCH4888945.1 hypothetical protein [Acidaminobacter sp. JC074]